MVMLVACRPSPTPISANPPRAASAPPQVTLPSQSLATSAPVATATRAFVSFKRDVQPILNKYCIKCHSDQSILTKTPNNFRVTSYADVMKGGEYGIDVIPFRPDDSRLIFFITGKKMPADGATVDPQDLDILIRWVAEGAQDN